MVEFFAQSSDMLFDFGIVLGESGDFFARMHSGGVVARAQVITDGGKRALEFFAKQIHGDLPRKSKFSLATLAE